jgi:uncharacterized metal-binding protein YceD (DUF177 family)
MANKDGHLGVEDVSSRGKFYKMVKKANREALNLHRNELLTMTRNIISDGMEKCAQLEVSVESVHATSALLRAVNQSVQIIPEMVLANDAMSSEEDEDAE